MRRILQISLGIWALASGMARGAPLDLTQYTQSFADNFVHHDITAYGGPGSVWIAHTPWNADFGNDVFDDPGPHSVFSFSKQGLTITARKIKGQWHSGLICSVDQTGTRGFTQKYGYFEMDSKLPGGIGTWPGFRLIGTDKQTGTSVIDVLEYFGHAPDEYRISEHDWVNGKDTLNASHIVRVPKDILSTRYNSFGAAITPRTITFYFNGEQVWQTPTPPAYNQPMYILAAFAIGGGWPYADLVSPREMHIRAIRAYTQHQ
jgi:hypothetical protein